MKNLLTLLLCLLAILPASGASTDYLSAKRKALKECFKNGIPDSLLWHSVDKITRDDSLSQAQVVQLFAEIVFPYAEKKRKQVSDLTLAVLYRSRALTYALLDSTEQYRTYMETAYRHICANTDSSFMARRQTGAVCYSYGSMHLNMGDVETAHQAFFRAMRFAEKINDYVMMMRCLYQTAVYYAQTEDTKQLDKIHAEMRRVCVLSGKNVTPFLLHTWYSVATVRYSMDKSTPAMADSAVFYSRKAIALLESHPEHFKGGTTNRAWDYYNHALLLIDAVPLNADSVKHYLRKASAVPGKTKLQKHEVDLNIHSAYGMLYKRLRQYPLAIRELTKAVEMMDADTLNTGIRQEKLSTCEDLVEIYTAMGNYKEAVEWQQKIIDFHSKVYDLKLSEQLNELSTKFDVERKDLQLRALNERQTQQAKIFRLMAVALIAAVVIIVFVVWTYVQHRRRLQDRLYQAALEAEMRMQELDAVKSQYSELKETMESRQTSRNFEKIIDRMKALVAASSIETSTRDEYLSRLARINPAEVEQQFATSLAQMTQMDIKYILCFLLEFKATDIAALFSVEPASVYTVRYRLRKKYRDNPSFLFLMR